MKKYLLLFVLLCSTLGFSQSVNDYQYVIVPTKFSIFKENDRFRMNSTTKLLLEKYGFKTFYSSDKLPAGIGENCDRLYVDLVEAKDFLQTKIKIVLKDCTEKVIYETDFGKSREKDFGLAYNQALRDAGKSFDKLNYKYNGKTAITNDIVEKKTETTTKVTETAQPYNYSEPLFAKPFGENGFQLLTNNTDVPRLVMTIYKTSLPDCYLVANGVLLRKSGKWFLEYYKNEKLVSELVTIVNLN